MEKILLIVSRGTCIVTAILLGLNLINLISINLPIVISTLLFSLATWLEMTALIKDQELWQLSHKLDKFNQEVK